MNGVCTLKDLKERPEELLSIVEETGEPLFIDRGGKAKTIVVNADAYLSDMQALNEFKRIFAEDSVQGQPQDIVREAWLKERLAAVS